MNSRKIHQVAGLILLLPMICWAITGIIFFIKPGYQQAYEQLSVKTYPMTEALMVKPKKNWQEAKLLKTILGYHLLVKIDGKTQHLDAITLQKKAPPTAKEQQALLNDAIAHNPSRYGEVIQGTSQHFITNTGIDLTLNWQTLSLRQQGNDSKLINTLYKIHYLQWTPNKLINQVLGISGLVLLTVLTFFGVRTYLTNRSNNQ